MNLLRRLMFTLWYLRHPPWDNGIVPPEVEAFIVAHPIQKSGRIPPRALDLGCGTGTSSLALARAGWAVTGVDFTRRAIKIAMQKAQTARLNIDFHVADVTHLPDNLFTIPYDLVLDIGCFHGLSLSGKAAYLGQLERLLAPGGTWLLYGFFKQAKRSGPGLTLSDLDKIPVILEQRKDGVDGKARPSAWFWFRK